MNTTTINTTPVPTLPPCPPGTPLIGHLSALRGPVHHNLLQARKQYGDVVRFQLGKRLIVSVSHPDIIKHILQDNNKNYKKGSGLEKTKPLLGESLITTSGDTWRWQRRMAQPAFHRKHIDHFVQVMVQNTSRLLARWQKRTDLAQPLDIMEAITPLALDIAAQTLFGTAITPEMTYAFTTYLPRLVKMAVPRMNPLFDIPDTWPTPTNRRIQRYVAQLDKPIYALIQKRRQLEADQPSQADLLGLLLAARDEETGESMTDKQLRDQSITLLSAGHETSVLLLSWTWMLLSQYPHIRQRMHQEVDQVLQGEPITAVTLPHLTYTRQIIDESLRLYPPAWLFTRQAIDSDQLGDYTIPADTDIFMSPYVIHRHPDFWYNPEGFDPDRFTPEQVKERHRYAYVPFGGGPRLCIGNTFALTEAVVILATVAQQYELNLTPGHPIEAEATYTLRPQFGISMTLQRR